ncbi:accessory gene regulator B family protein [Paenibacillus sp. NPDC056579]|uniref:accessory gene regulator B family protein n=1 Tax=Paenibacillus sp. NPDC056579 TaxID=3345871 RepID=UPI0036A2107B
MNPIDAAAARIAEFIRKHNDKAASKELLTYSLIITLNTLIALLISMLVCVFTGNFDRFVVVFLVFTALRYFTGGAHLNSSLSCCIFTIVVFVSLVHIHYPYMYLGLVFDIISFILFALKAPSGIDVIRKVSRKHKILIKSISLLLISANFILQNSLLSSIIIVQAFSFTSLFQKIAGLEGGITHEESTSHDS